MKYLRTNQNHPSRKQNPKKQPALALLGASALLFASNQAWSNSPLPCPENAPLVIGDYLLEDNPVVDGDTIRVKGMKQRLRLLGIDTEETYKKEENRQLADKDFVAYTKKMRGNAEKPVKMGTPLGEEAKTFAEHFFQGITQVRLERDDPQEIRGYYDRALAYVFVERDGSWVNYNVACVRAGMSPYFVKYGYSRRFHKAFLNAEQEAKKAKRGIWHPNKKHYPDYDERLAWWTRRADLIEAFEKNAKDKPNFISLTKENALCRIAHRVGEKVVLFGSVGDVYQTRSGIWRAYLYRKKGENFPLVFFEQNVLDASQIAKHAGEYIWVTGTVKKHVYKESKDSELQIVVTHPGQISATGTWVPGQAGKTNP